MQASATQSISAVDGRASVHVSGAQGVGVARGPQRHRRAALLGVAAGWGQGRPGVETGPTAIRAAGLSQALLRLGYELTDKGDVTGPAPTVAEGERSPRRLRSVLAACQLHGQSMGWALREGVVPISIGGDHSLSIGSWWGIQQSQPKAGLLWVDAHGDFNTPGSSPSGNIHGMALAAIMGVGHSPLNAFLADVRPAAPESTVLIGVRDLDPLEKKFVRDAGLTCYTMHDIDSLGMAQVMDEAVSTLTRGGRRFHVSFDIDAVDPAHAPGTGTPVDGGLTLREARFLMEMVAETGRLAALDLAEVNPFFDQGDKTARLAVDLIATAMGKTIL